MYPEQKNFAWMIENVQIFTNPWKLDGDARSQNLFVEPACVRLPKSREYRE